MFTVIKITHRPAEAEIESGRRASALRLALAVVHEEGIEAGENDYEVHIFTDEHVARLWHEDQPEEENVSYWHGEETL